MKKAREISQKIRLSEHRDSLELVTRWATRADDLLQSLNEYRPVIVQFSGHGSNTEEILLQDASRAPQAVSKAALKQLFSTCKDNIRVVVLNACYSRPQAEAITEVIDCAIGMKKSISDDAARTFAASFYRAIGFGRSVKEAFEQGKTALMLEGIPEAQTPDLLVRAGVDPAEVILAAHNREVVATIEFTLDEPLPFFDPETFKSALRACTGIEASKIRITSIAEGSTKLTIEAAPEVISQIIASLTGSETTLDHFAELTKLTKLVWTVKGSRHEMAVEQAHGKKSTEIPRALRPGQPNPKKVFISYSHSDRKFLDEFVQHLKPLERAGLVHSWFDTQILAGSQWRAEIERALDEASVAVMLVSPRFLASEFIYSNEFEPLLRNAQRRGVKILWVPVRASSYRETALERYQALISPDRPIAELKANRDRAWVAVCERIKQALGAAVILQLSPSYESEVDSSAATSAAVAQLAELGWTVRPGDNDILFEVANRALPPMKESAAHFTQVKKPFTLHFRSIKSLDGLHYLAGIKNCSKIEINAGEFTDISELQGFAHLTSLIISQVPLNGDGIVDASTLASLTNLELLNLNGSRVRFTDFLAPLKKLKALNLGHTLVADLSSISGTSTLVSLEIRETRITDLTPLVDDQSLAELKISNEQVFGLVDLAHLKNLKRLVLIDQRSVDLTPIGSLSNLESIFIWGLPQFDLAPLDRLSKLQNLQLSGIGFDRGLSGVRNLAAIGDLNNLKTLTLGQLEVNNLSFAENLRNLVELNLNQLPILSLASVRGLSSLRKISLVDMPVVDISPLLELPQLSELFLLRVPARVDVLTELKRRGVRVTP